MDLSRLCRRTVLPAAQPFLGCSAIGAEEPTLSEVNVTAKGYASVDLETPIATAGLDRGEPLFQMPADEVSLDWLGYEIKAPGRSFQLTWRGSF